MSNLTTMNQPGMTGANELGISRKVADSMSEMQAHVFLARQFPRDEAAATVRVIEAARELGRAKLGDNYQGVEYVYPRGDKQVHGPSVYFAKEAVRIWQHVHYGIRILEESDEQVSCEAWAWDVQNGTRPSAAFLVKKLQQRKDKKGNTSWVVPDTRDLRELINNIGARAVRNCLLEILPYTLVSQAVAAARQASVDDVKKDSKSALDDLVQAFGSIGISKDDLKAYLGHPVTDKRVTAEEIAELRGIGRAIRDKQAQWSDYVKPGGAGKAAGPEEEIDLRKVFSESTAAEAAAPTGGERLKFGQKPGAKNNYPD